MRIMPILSGALLLFSTCVSNASDFTMSGARFHLPKGHGPIVIWNDDGGNTSEYNARFERMNSSGRLVQIKGMCFSACARYMKLDRVCAVKGARFYFHAATVAEEVAPEFSEADSRDTDTPTAFALESKYDTFHMGVTLTRPYAHKKMEAGVDIVYMPIPWHGSEAFQEFLAVDADKLIPSCH